MRRLKVSDNRRFLAWENGDPFFWLADTAWEIFHRATLEEARFYLEDRRQKGFTVIQAVVLAEFDGLRSPNVYGECPLLGEDPLRPNEGYFRFVDQVIDLAARQGIWVGLLPTWGDKLELLAHGQGPVIFNPANARAYGVWLGRRYRETENLIWINGGDRQGGGANRPIWEALAEGIKSADPNHLMTFHPLGGGGGHSSSEWFQDAAWLDFNLAQSGHEGKHHPNFALVDRDYQLPPNKPCLDGEPRYEDHAVNWKPQELGWFDDYDVRQAAYWAVFAGACGHTYGCHPVWQWFDERRAPITFARRHWREALDLPGAGQMRHVRTLLESRPILSRVPDQTLLSAEGIGPAHRRACRGEGYILVYLPQGGTVTVNPASLGGPTLRRWWFDPRTGRCHGGDVLSFQDRLDCTAPHAGPCNDWVLVLDNAAHNYPPPGLEAALNP